jgi:hypothetical protein
MLLRSNQPDVFIEVENFDIEKELVTISPHQVQPRLVLRFGIYESNLDTARGGYGEREGGFSQELEAAEGGHSISFRRTVTKRPVHKSSHVIRQG